MISKEIFKSYDVRGVYPQDLNEQAAFAVGRAFVKYTGAKKIVVGHDARISSPALFKALTLGLFAEGAQITSIGQTPTEGLYFAVASYDFDAGIMITASHNPKEYNGFKMMKRSGNDIVWVRGKDLLGLVEDDIFTESSVDIKDLNIWPEYMQLMDSFFDAKSIKPFNIVVDASNGVMGNIIEIIKDKLPSKIIPLNFVPDGNFPNHSPNPLDEGSVNQIAEKIKATGADFGFMFDGDADRIFLVDENGHMVSADIVLLLLAKYFLQKNPGSAIAYNLICSRSVPEFIAKWGGMPVRTQVGFVNVREGLIKNNGIMGGELSAHYCFRDYFYMDSGMVAFLTLLQIISKEAKPVSEIVKDLTVYAKPLQLTFNISDQQAVLEKVKETYADGKQDFLDGLTVEYESWWFNLRPSNTEPLLKLTIEASNKDLLMEKEIQLREFINKK